MIKTLAFLLLFFCAAKAEEPLFTLYGHSNSVNSVSFSPDGTKIASGSWDKTVKIWDTETGKEIRTLNGHSNIVNSVSFSPDGTKIASGSWDKTVKIWDTKTGKEIRTLYGHSLSVESVSFSPDGTKIASGSNDKTVKIWETKTGKKIRTLNGHSYDVNSVSFSPDGTKIASGSDDYTVKIWDTETGKEIRTLNGHSNSVLSVSFSPDGTKIASGSWDNTVKIWDTETGKEIRTLYGHSYDVNSVSFSPDGTKIASGSWDKTVKIWDTKTGKEIRTLYGHSLSVNSVSFSPDGTKIASGSNDKTVKIWEVPDTEDKPQKITAPPNLLVAEILFTEPSGNKALDGEETATLSFKIQNTGKGTAYGVKVKTQNKSTEKNIGFEPETVAGKIAPNETKTVALKLSANENVGSSEVLLTVSFEETNGFPPESFNFGFNTKAFDPPELVLAKVGISEEGGNGNYKIEPAEVIEVTAIVQNKGFGDAASVKAEILVSNPNVFLLSEKSVFTLGKIPAGDFSEVKFSFTVNKKFEGTSLPVSLKVTEEKGRFGFSKSLGLELNRVTFAAKDIKIQKTEQVKNIDFKTLPELTADVDLNLPKTKTENSDAFAVVIGNTNYEKAKLVTFAQNDANSVRRYLIESLGFKEGNIFFVKDARKSDFELYFGSKESFKGKLYNNLKPQKSDVFIFYSGHGAPSLKEKKGFFVPVECDPSYVEIQGYSLDVFYENLSKLPAKSVTVVLDACFSGANIFENISPLVLSFESSVFKLKNGVVLSSSSGSQVSSWFEEKKHGLFTYFFLKSIHNGNGDKNRDGKLTFDEIFGFVTDESEGVPYFARKLNGIEQVPVLQGTDKEKVFVVYR